MRAGDVIEYDFGVPVGHEAGFIRPAVVITAMPNPTARIVHLVPCTSTERRWPLEVATEFGAAQCWLVAAQPIAAWGHVTLGNVGAVALRQIREIVADLLGTCDDH